MPYGDIQHSVERASALLKAMSNKRRLLILCYLSEGERSVGELCAMVKLSQSALSQHLARLRRDGLVETRRSAQSVYYSIAPGEVESILHTLHGLYCSKPAAPPLRPRDRPPAPRRPI
jgi:ArsR family transcriptional regulator, virulence genes transcriptional regulator